MAARIEELEHDLLRAYEKRKSTSEKLSQLKSSFTELVYAKAINQIAHVIA